MTAGAITALSFRKLKQITIKESLDVGKHAALHRAVSLRLHDFLVYISLVFRHRNFNMYCGPVLPFAGRKCRIDQIDSKLYSFYSRLAMMIYDLYRAKLVGPR